MDHLPIDDVLPALRAALRDRHEAVLEAPPGAGKTTRVPLALLDEPWCSGRILMLEPRRLAARAAAERLAAELGESVGETVGYSIRLERRVGPATRIEVVTEGILTRRLQADPSLEGVDLLIFDEFHERSLEADLALALALNGREWLREAPLKLLLMSATLDGERLADWLQQAPLVSSAGRQFPVELRWSALRDRERLEEGLSRLVLRALAEESGSLLVFLPGQGEIQRLAERLGHELQDDDRIEVHGLYGELSLDQQRRAIEPAAAGQRKIVLATNIAETSLTIEGIRIVIDAGLARVPRYDPGSGLTRLETRRISRAAATQRAGRAGRLEPGICYRLWSEAEHGQRPAHETPEMLQADLSGLALQLAGWGVAPDELQWLDQPPGAAFEQAGDLLVQLGALAERGAPLTPHGRQLAGLPLHPRLGHMLLMAQRLGQVALAADLAALLVERDPLGREAGVDLALRLGLMGEKKAGRGFQRIRQLARQFRQALSERASDPLDTAAVPADDWPGILLALAYPDRIACQRQTGGQGYQLANGRGAQFAVADVLLREPWLVMAEVGSQQGSRTEVVRRAVALDPRWFDSLLAELVRTQDLQAWDEQEQVLRAERQQRVGCLVLSRQPLAEPDESARVAALLEVVRRKGLEILDWSPALRQWQARVQLLRSLDLQQADDSVWPDVSDAGLLVSLEVWLAPYLSSVQRLAHFARLDLAAMLQTLLPWPLPQDLERLAPQTLSVPSGSRIRLDYLQQPPVLAVRLQEVFGLAATPCVAEGRQPVLLHLLSPARRPVQVTQDLASFWAGTYAEVRKDLKGRYPKHYWPEDPHQAEPTARVRPRR